MTGRDKFKGSPLSEDYLNRPPTDDGGLMPLDFSNDRLPPGVTRKRLRELGYGA